MTKKYYCINDEWFYKLQDDIRNLKKCQYQESYNESLDDIIKIIKAKFKEYDVKIAEE